MNTFKEWMDAKGVTAEQAADIFGKTVGTIRNWRSGGVPASQRNWVDRRIHEWSGKAPPETPARLPLEVSREQFREWNKAAMHVGKLIEDWAVDVLDQAAEADGDDGSADQTGYGASLNPVEFPRAAEDGGPGYSAKNRDAG